MLWSIESLPLLQRELMFASTWNGSRYARCVGPISSKLKDDQALLQPLLLSYSEYTLLVFSISPLRLGFNTKSLVLLSRSAGSCSSICWIGVQDREGVRWNLWRTSVGVSWWEDICVAVAKTAGGGLESWMVDMMIGVEWHEWRESIGLNDAA